MNETDETKVTAPDKLSRLVVTVHHFRDGKYVNSNPTYTYDNLHGTKVVRGLAGDLSPDWEDGDGDEPPGEGDQPDTG